MLDGYGGRDDQIGGYDQNIFKFKSVFIIK